MTPRRSSSRRVPMTAAGWPPTPRIRSDVLVSPPSYNATTRGNECFLIITRPTGLFNQSRAEFRRDTPNPPRSQSLVFPEDDTDEIQKPACSHIREPGPSGLSPRHPYGLPTHFLHPSSRLPITLVAGCRGIVRLLPRRVFSGNAHKVPSCLHRRDSRRRRRQSSRDNRSIAGLPEAICTWPPSIAGMISPSPL